MPLQPDDRTENLGRPWGHGSLVDRNVPAAGPWTPDSPLLDAPFHVDFGPEDISPGLVPYCKPTAVTAIRSAIAFANLAFSPSASPTCFFVLDCLFLFVSIYVEAEGPSRAITDDSDIAQSPRRGRSLTRSRHSNLLDAIAMHRRDRGFAVLSTSARIAL